MPFHAELDLAGREVLVVGGGALLLSKITSLLQAEARVAVIAPEVATSIRDLAERSLITWEPRNFATADLDHAALLITDSSPTSQTARAANVPVVFVDSSAASLTSGTQGEVILIGGGPGDPGLLTVAGLEAVRRADVIVCDRLAPLAVLDQVRPGATIIDVGKIPRGAYTPQEKINEILIEHAQRGQVVARLKGGDNFVFGRGGEEWQACAQAGVAVTVIPGVSSATAVPGLAGVPLTHRTLTQGFTVVSGHLPPDHPGSTLNWASLATAGTTLVILMGVAQLPAIVRTLISHGLAETTPAAIIADGGLPSMRTVRGTLDTIADDSHSAGIQAPAVIVIGAVAGFDPTA